MLFWNHMRMKPAKAGFQIQRSLRFRSGASAYLSKSFTSTANTWTLSLWVKRGALGASSALAATRQAGVNSAGVFFNADDTLSIVLNNTSVLTTAAVYRDPTAWYHVVARVTQSGTSFLYVNGVQVGSWTSGSVSWLFTNTAGFTNAIGRNGDSATSQLDGYLAGIVYVDGQALDPTAFGEFSTNGQWRPKAYSGSYGTTGFNLSFADPTNLTTLVSDSSGNGNNWTANNVSLTAGTTYDSMLDVPLGGGGSGRGNYCTWSPLDSLTNKPTNGNLRAGHNAGEATRATHFNDTGKWYYEFQYDTITSGAALGISTSAASLGTYPGASAAGYGLNPNTGNKNNAGVGAAYGASQTTSDIVGVAYDLDNGKIWWSKNGTWQASGDPAAGTNAAYTGLSGAFTPILGIDPGGGVNGGYANFGQRPFAYTPPNGFKALHTGNLPEPSIPNPSLHHNIVAWVGTGATLVITGVGFALDMLWGKCRSAVTSWSQHDTVRGITNRLNSNTTSAEITDTSVVASVQSDGFTLGTSTALNGSGAANVGWAWKAGGAPVTNNAGSISAQVSANVAAGFSIASYTGSGAAATVGHGLGIAPKMVIVKQRNGTNAWVVLHQSANGGSGHLGYLLLAGTGAFTTSSTEWNNTQPTSTLLALGTSGASNAAASTYVAYCFAEVPGYSAMGSYTGNGSADGPPINCGFKPRFLLVRRTDAAGNWYIYDAARNTYNAVMLDLYPNLPNAEINNARGFDFLANGFKCRSSDAETNASGGTYIYMAFAEAPFKYALAR